MKMQYENAEMDIIEFEVLDVLTLSNGGEESGDDGWGDII